MTLEPPEQPTQYLPAVPLAFRDDPAVTVHPAEAPYEVRIELSLMPRDWDRLQKLVMGNPHPTTMHRVLTHCLRRGIDDYYPGGGQPW